MNAALRRSARFLRGLLPGARDWDAVRRAPGRDLIAGVTVALVALPLALAFGQASGLGAQAGLVTAVLAGAVAAIFGGSNLQVSGPTGAMTVVLVPVVRSHGAAGLLQVGLMAGVILVVLAVTRIGRAVRYLPISVVEGFTAGIAVVIALQQVPNIFGEKAGDQEQTWAIAADVVVRWAQHPLWIPVAVAAVVCAAILLGARWKPAWPISLAAVVVATAVVFFARIPVDVLGTMPPLFSAPTAAFWDWTQLGALLPSAAAVAALAALESLLCATAADGMTVGERHDPDRELLGQGLANILVPFFGGVPATAAIARTAVNVRSGARSRLAALTHAVVLAAIVMAAAPLVGAIPLAALGGVLLATTIRMIDPRGLWATLRATWADGIVLLATFLVTVLVDLVTAVAIGFGIAALLALLEVSRSARLERVPVVEGEQQVAEEEALLHEHIVAYRIDGPLFFGAAHRFLHELQGVASVKVLILRLSRVTTLDATGARILDDAVRGLERRGITVLVSGAKPGHRGVLARSGALLGLADQGRVFATTPEAIEHARMLIQPERAEAA